MALFGGAEWWPINNVVKHGMESVLGLHIVGINSSDTWFADLQGAASAHFASLDGSFLRQIADTQDRPANAPSNWLVLAVEGQDLSRHLNNAAQLLAWASRTTGFELKLASSETDTGLLTSLTAFQDLIENAAAINGTTIVSKAPVVAPERPKSMYGITAHPGLQLGMSGTSVAHFQSLIGVAPTGSFDAALEAEIKNVQTAHGLPVSGVVDSATWACVHPILDQSSSGLAVGELQSCLGLVQTDQFDQSTQDALLNYKQAYGLDGTTVDASTWKVFFN